MRSDAKVALSPAAQKAATEGRLHVVSTLLSKHAADVAMAMFVHRDVPASCSVVMLSEDAIFLQAQHTLQEAEQKRAPVFVLRQNAFDAVAELLAGLCCVSLTQLEPRPRPLQQRPKAAKEIKKANTKVLRAVGGVTKGKQSKAVKKAKAKASKANRGAASAALCGSGVSPDSSWGEWWDAGINW